MIELVRHPIKSGEVLDTGEDRRVELFLYQMENRGKPPVLLLHGASAQHESFLIPRRDLDGRVRSLAEYLFGEGFEPWLLDWRGSREVVDAAKKKTPSFEDLQECFDFDHAADYDIPNALEAIADSRGDGQKKVSIDVVGHCMGGGTLAQTLASGKARSDRYEVKHIVLLALGLFYEPSLEGELKAQAHVLENLQQGGEPVLEVDPRLALEKWPTSLQTFYRNLGREPHAGTASDAGGICNRVTFMYGPPYAESNLVPEIHRDVWMLRFRSGQHQAEVGDRLRGATSDARATLVDLTLEAGSWRRGDASGTMVLADAEGAFAEDEALLQDESRVGEIAAARFYSAELPRQFGSIPLRMFAHGAQNVRRGWAGRYGSPNDDTAMKEREAAARMLEGLDMVTLISGSENQLWRPRSISQMHEWLINSGAPRARQRCRRHVESGFAHQDLLWGRDAPKKIFPLIVAGLRGGP